MSSPVSAPTSESTAPSSPTLSQTSMSITGHPDLSSSPPYPKGKQVVEASLAKQFTQAIIRSGETQGHRCDRQAYEGVSAAVLARRLAALADDDVTARVLLDVFVAAMESTPVLLKDYPNIIAKNAGMGEGTIDVGWKEKYSGVTKVDLASDIEDNLNRQIRELRGERDEAQNALRNLNQVHQEQVARLTQALEEAFTGEGDRNKEEGVRQCHKPGRYPDSGKTDVVRTPLYDLHSTTRTECEDLYSDIEALRAALRREQLEHRASEDELDRNRYVSSLNSHNSLTSLAYLGRQR